MLDFDRFEALTFDCYGTLIDWESGILSAVRPVLAAHGKDLDDSEILRLYAELESRIERQGFQSYRTVLRRVMEGFGEKLGFVPGEVERSGLADSLGTWPPFPDTVGALRFLKSRFRLGIVSNVDDDLFVATARRLEVEFDWLVTAGQVGAYKPSRSVFEAALERIAIAKSSILHVAQSLYHDIGPAREIGLATVWVDRRMDKAGFGATPEGEARADLTVPDLRALVAAIDPSATV
jgi:2-haloacid dehalogenase